MQVKTKGIVLNETPYSETSKILNILTEDYGMISVISKGCRNMKNKLRGISNKMNFCEYTISYKDNGLSTLIEGYTIDSFKNVYGDIKKSFYSFYLMDLVNQVLKENNDKNIFSLLTSALIKINQGLSPELISIIIEIKLLEYLGVGINLNECTLCGKKEDLVTISLKDGGCICQDCYQGGFIFNSKALKLMQILENIDIKRLDKLLVTDDTVLKDIDNFLNEYYSFYTGVYLKRKDGLLKF